MKNFIKKLFSTSLLAVATAIALISQSFAMSTPGLISLSNPSAGFGAFRSQITGWSFTAVEDFQITALGFADINNLFNQPASIGLESQHSVTLWDISGTSLASVTVQQGTGSPIGPGTLTFNGGIGDGVFRYETLATPVSLSAGSQYVISAFYQRFNSDPRAFDVRTSVGIYNSLITPTGSRFLEANSHVFPTTFSFPTSTVGPNFLAAPLSVVPLPAALPLYGTGLALMGFIGWRRRKKSVAGVGQ